MASTTSSKVFQFLIKLAVVAVVLFAAYTWLVLSWSYSSGERAGYVQKLSKKGWICKTWEGEMALISMPGTVAEKFYFTVSDEKIAADINHSIGKRVALNYKQHIGIPTSCFGDTQYFISSVKIVEEPPVPTSPISPALPGSTNTSPTAPPASTN